MLTGSCPQSLLSLGLVAPVWRGTEQVPVCEGAAGAGFQVSLEAFGARLVWQGDVGPDGPRDEVACVGRFSSIVLSQAGLQVVGVADVGLVGMRDAA